MSLSKLRKQESGSRTVKLRGQLAAASRNTTAKLPGTRAGTLQDWRASGKGTGESSAARRNRLRDGQ
jgi:hypothetical protein